MATADELKVKITADAAQLKRETRASSAAMGRMGAKGQAAGRKVDQGMQSAARGARALKVGILAAGAALVAFGAVTSKTAGAAIRLERLQARITAQIKGTGKAAGFTTAEIVEFAREMDKLTLGSKQGFLEASSILLTFKAVQGDVFKDAIRRAQDMAEIYGGDVKSAIVQLGKVLEDPIRNLSALARTGTTFTKAQTDMIHALVKSNRLLDAQKLILKEIASQTANAAVGAAKTTAGAVDEMSMAWTEFKEKVGKEVLPVLTRAIGDLTEKLNDPAVIEGAKNLATGVAGWLMKIADALSFISTKWTAFKNLVSLGLGHGLPIPINPNSLTDALRGTVFGKGLRVPITGSFPPGTLTEEQQRERSRFTEPPRQPGRTPPPARTLGGGKGKSTPAPLGTLKDAESMFPALKEMKEAAAEMDKAIKETIARQRAALAELTDVVSGGMQNAMDGVVDAIFDGKNAIESLKASVKEFAKELIKTFLRMAIINPLVNSMFGGLGGGGGGGGLSTLGQALGGMAGLSARAGGGNLRSNFPTLVGEKGPELLPAGMGGKILSNSQTRQAMGGGPTIIADLRGADPAAITRLESLVRDIDGTLERRAVDAVISERSRGGAMAKAFG